MIEDTTIIIPLSNRHLNVISLSLIVEERLTENSTIRIVDYNKADWDGIRDVLGRVEWDEWITDNATTGENLETFTTIVESACKSIKNSNNNKTRRRRSVWINRKEKKEDYKTWEKYRQTGQIEETTNNIGRHSTRPQIKTVKKANGDFEIKLAAEIKIERGLRSWKKSRGTLNHCSRVQDPN